MKTAFGDRGPGKPVTAQSVAGGDTEEYCWLLRGTNRSDGGGAILASLAVHGALFFLLTSSSSFLPLTGDTASFDLLWLSASSLPDEASGAHSRLPARDRGAAPAAAALGLGTEPALSKPPVFTVGDTATADAEPEIQEAGGEADGAHLALAAVPDREKHVPAEEPAAHRELAAITREKGPDRPAGRNAETTARSSAQPAPHQALGEPSVAATGRASARPEGEEPRERREPRPRPPLPAGTKAPPSTLEAFSLAKITKSPGSEGSETRTVRQEAAHQQAPELRHPAASGKPSPSQASVASAPPQRAPAKAEITYRDTPAQPVSKPAAVKAPPYAEIPAETPRPQPKQTQPEPKGLVIPAVHGDLKLVIEGGSEIKLAFLFRDYPRSRRTRTPTRAEAGRTQKLSPVVIKTADQARQAVIERVAEGVYLLIAETEEGHPAEANFTLKLYELSARKRIKPLGKKTVSGRVVIAKILMPEAIIWDDESAFTGSMVDSDSVTKFNAATGLVWKEYSE